MPYIKLSALLSERRKQFLLERYKGLTEPEIAFLQKTDPSDKGDFADWILKNLKNKNILTEDSDKIHALLTKFIRLKNSPKFKEKHSSDINTYSPQELWKTIDEGELSKKERYRLRDTQAKEIAMGPFSVYKVERVEDAGILGQGTNWCTANNPTLSREYLAEAPLWVVYQDNLPYAQIHGPSKQFMDPSDTPKFFTYDSTYDPTVTNTINYVNKEDLELLKEISQQDSTVEENLYSNMEAKRAPKEIDLETLFKNFSSKEFFLFVKLYEITSRFEERWEDALFEKVVYPEEREFYYSLFEGPDTNLEKKFENTKNKVSKFNRLWILDYYTYVLKEKAPDWVLGGISDQDYSYLLHQAINGDYLNFFGKYEGTYYQVLNKILDMRAIRYADPAFEKAALYLLSLDTENPEYIKLVARYAVGLKKAPIPELDDAIREQWIPEIPILRYIRKYYPDYLTTDVGSRYIFALMEIASERDPLLEEKLDYQAANYVRHRGIAQVVINYLTRFKIKNDEVLKTLDGNNSWDYVNYLKAVGEPLEKVLMKYENIQGNWYGGVVRDFVSIVEERNTYFEEHAGENFSVQIIPSLISYVGKFKCHLPGEVELMIFESGESVSYCRALGGRMLPFTEKRMFDKVLELCKYAEEMNLTLWGILGNLDEVEPDDSGDAFVSFAISLEVYGNRMKNIYFKYVLDYLMKKKDGREDMKVDAWTAVIDNYSNKQEIKRALLRAPLDPASREKLLSLVQ